MGTRRSAASRVVAPGSVRGDRDVAGRANRGGVSGAARNRGQSRAAPAREDNEARVDQMALAILTTIRALASPCSCPGSGHLIEECPAGGHHDEDRAPNPSRSFAGPSGMAPAFVSTNMYASHSTRITPATRGHARRQPEDTVLYSVVQDHLATLLDTARDRSEHGFGHPQFVEREFEKFLACGLLCHGFVRVRCAHQREQLAVHARRRPGRRRRRPARSPSARPGRRRRPAAPPGSARWSRIPNYY